MDNRTEHEKALDAKSEKITQDNLKKEITYLESEIINKKNQLFEAKQNYLKSKGWTIKPGPFDDCTQYTKNDDMTYGVNYAMRLECIQ